MQLYNIALVHAYVYTATYANMLLLWLLHLSLCPLFSCRLFDTSEEQVEQKEEEKLEDDSPQPASQSYAATVALPSTPPSSTTLMGTYTCGWKWSKPS